MKKSFVGCLVLCVLAACTSRGVPNVPAPTPEAQVGSRDIELLELRRLESSLAEVTVVVRVASGAPGPMLLGIDVRAEPGMWFAPVRQQTALNYLPPEGERTFSVDYSFAHLSPEGVLHVRIGAAEEHGDGWLYVPEPVAVRRFDQGRSDAARAILDRFDRRATPQLTVYAIRGMFSAEQFDSVAASRVQAVLELSRMLDVQPPPGLTLVFYPDGASKTADTHHVGAGMTRGDATLSPMGSAQENEAAFVRAFGVSSEEAAGLWMAHLEQLCS